MMIVFWILLVVVVYFLLKGSGKIDFGNRSKPDPESVLKQRYVNGEIDDDTYSKMLKTLRNEGGSR